MTHVFKVVLSLTLLNTLGLLKSRGNYKTIFFSYISIYIYIFNKYINFCPKIWGLPLVGGPRRWPKWPRPRAGPISTTVLTWSNIVIKLDPNIVKKSQC